MHSLKNLFKISAKLAFHIAAELVTAIPPERIDQRHQFQSQQYKQDTAKAHLPKMQIQYKRWLDANGHQRWLRHRQNQTDCCCCLGLVASSARYTRPLKLMPLWFDRLISHVLDVEYPSVQPLVCRCCKAAPVNSGYLIPLSPAMPASSKINP